MELVPCTEDTWAEGDDAEPGWWTLPVELHVRIFSFLSPRELINGRGGLLLVCRRWTTLLLGCNYLWKQWHTAEHSLATPTATTAASCVDLEHFGLSSDEYGSCNYEGATGPALSWRERYVAECRYLSTLKWCHVHPKLSLHETATDAANNPSTSISGASKPEKVEMDERTKRLRVVASCQGIGPWKGAVIERPITKGLHYW